MEKRRREQMRKQKQVKKQQRRIQRAERRSADEPESGKDADLGGLVSGAEQNQAPDRPPT